MRAGGVVVSQDPATVLTRIQIPASASLPNTTSRETATSFAALSNRASRRPTAETLAPVISTLMRAWPVPETRTRRDELRAGRGCPAPGHRARVAQRQSACPLYDRKLDGSNPPASFSGRYDRRTTVCPTHVELSRRRSTDISGPRRFTTSRESHPSVRLRWMQRVCSALARTRREYPGAVPSRTRSGLTFETFSGRGRVNTGYGRRTLSDTRRGDAR